MGSDLVYIEVCRDLVFGDVCSILLQTMRSEIFCSLSSLDVVTDVRVLVVGHISFFVEHRSERTCFWLSATTS